MQRDTNKLWGLASDAFPICMETASSHIDGLGLSTESFTKWGPHLIKEFESKMFFADQGRTS
eukprot:11186114-Lingulodinium_polyedra.AAC.1